MKGGLFIRKGHLAVAASLLINWKAALIPGIIQVGRFSSPDFARSRHGRSSMRCHVLLDFDRKIKTLTAPCGRRPQRHLDLAFISPDQPVRFLRRFQASGEFFRLLATLHRPGVDLEERDIPLILRQ